jgi:hypothetical protein
MLRRVLSVTVVVLAACSRQQRPVDLTEVLAPAADSVISVLTRGGSRSVRIVFTDSLSQALLAPRVARAGLRVAPGFTKETVACRANAADSTGGVSVSVQLDSLIGNRAIISWSMGCTHRDPDTGGRSMSGYGEGGELEVYRASPHWRVRKAGRWEI